MSEPKFNGLCQHSNVIGSCPLCSSTGDAPPGVGAMCPRCGSVYCPTPGICGVVGPLTSVDADLVELAKMVEAMKATGDKAAALRYLISRFWTGGVANLIECAK